MSLADGQLVLETSSSQADQPLSSQSPASTSQEQTAAPAWQSYTGCNVDASRSVSRIGARAHPPAMATLAPSIRFDLAQAEDAQRFNADRGGSGLYHKQLQRAALVQAAIAQPVRSPLPLEEQVGLSLRSIQFAVQYVTSMQRADLNLH